MNYSECILLLLLIPNVQFSFYVVGGGEHVRAGIQIQRQDELRAGELSQVGYCYTVCFIIPFGYSMYTLHSTHNGLYVVLMDTKTGSVQSWLTHLK